MAHRVVYFDLETRKLAQDLSPHRETGWDLLREGKGGISALAIYDSEEDWTFLYDDHSILDAALHLESADVVVGFRSQAFDVPVIEGVLGRNLRLREHIDIYESVQQALGGRMLRGRAGEYTLDAISKRTLGRGKIEHGEHAPALARQGKWARLFRYCMDDVRLTRDLFAYIRDEGGIRGAGGIFLDIELPEYLRPS